MRIKLVTALAAIALSSGTAYAQDFPTITLSAHQVERLGITVQTVEKANSVALFELVGRVMRAPDGTATVVAPFAGTITKIHVLPGATIKAGAPIATIASRDFASTASLLEQAKAEASAAATALARQTQLVELGLAPRSSLENAEVRVRSANAQVRERQSLGGAGSSADGQSGSYVVRAPAGGRLSNLAGHVGDSIEGMSPLASLTTSNSLWVEFQIPVRMIGQIAPGDIATLPGGNTAAILSVTDIIDPTTRSASAIAALPDGFVAFDGQLLRAKLSTPAEAADLVQTPARAVVQLAGVDYVFRRTTDGFSPTPVNVVGKTAEAATIGGGLLPGEAVATTGLTELKSLAMQQIQ